MLNDEEMLFARFKGVMDRKVAAGLVVPAESQKPPNSALNRAWTRAAIVARATVFGVRAHAG